MEQNECYICMDEGGKLISPCGCKGSTGVVHLACLQKWIRISGIEYCRACEQLYNCERGRKPMWSCFICFCGGIESDGFDSSEIMPDDEVE
jgi:hypothetical protein